MKTDDPKTSTPAAKSPRRILLLVMAGVAAVVIFALRSHTFDEPLEADEALYALIADDWAEGGKPYVTLWDNKPIGTFIIYRAAIAIADHDERGPKLMALGAVIVSTFLLLLLLRTCSLPTIACCLVVLWPALSTDVHTYANGANMEIFICVFILAALLCCRRLTTTGGHWEFYLAIFLLTLGALVKHMILPFFLIPFVALPLSEWRRWEMMLARCAAAAAIVVLTHVVVYAVCGYPIDHALTQFHENTQFVSRTTERNPLFFFKLLLSVPFHSSLRWSLPILIPGVVGLCLGLRERAHRHVSVLYLSAFAAAAIAIALSSAEFAHYYILLLPLAVIGFAMFLERLDARASVQWAIIAGACLYMGAATWQGYLRHNSDQISINKYENAWFLVDRAIGRQLVIKGITGKRVFVDGSHPGILFYSQNRPATKIFVAWVWLSMNVATWNDVFTELKSAPPDYCVLLNPTTGDFAAWLEANYKRIDSIQYARSPDFSAEIYIRESIP